MTINFAPLDNVAARIEKGGNLAGYLFGFATGPLRIVAGKVEMIAGTLFSLGYLLMYAISRDPDPSFLDNAKESSGYVIHGAANILRGAIETVNLLGGVFLLLIYDFGIGRFHYSDEPREFGVETLNPCHPDAQSKDGRRRHV